MKKLPISLVVITKNEEANIERCLRSVPFASECLVVDSGSTDQTLVRAQALGARVIVEAWRGYGRQKKFAADQASESWILSLDADEALSPELAQEIQDRFDSLDPKTGYLMSRKSFHLGRWILRGGWFPDWQLRLFNRAESQWKDSEIHEKVEASRTERLTGSILHWVFEDLSDQVRTNDHYSSLQARDLAVSGKRFSVWKLLSKPFSKFLETYLWKRGFLDGLPGLIISVGAAYSVFLKWAKLWEIERTKKS